MNLRLIAGLGMAVCSLAAAYAHKPATLSLDDCLAIALSDNPTVKVADMEVRRMDYSRKEVIGNLLPNIDFSGSYSRTLEKQVMYMNMDGFGDFGKPGTGEDAAEVASRAASRASGGGGNGIKVGLDNSYSMGFSASLPIIAPQLWKSISLSDAQIARSLEAARQSRQSLVNQVKSAYYTLLLAIDSRQVIQESYDMAALTYETYSKQYAAGAASDYDVLRTSVAMKNIEPQLMQADIAIKQARLQLLLLMGIDSTIDFDVADRLSNYEETMYGDALAISDPDFSANADLRLLDLDKKILEKNLTVQKLAFSPTLALAANYNWTAMNNGSPFRNVRWTPYSSVGLSLSVPLFQGGRRWNAVKQTKLQVEELQLQRENLERSVAMQVNIAVDNIKINVKQIASCSESVRQADKAHSIMEKSFDIGAASYLNLRDSELALTQARLAYYQAIYNYLVANSELELLLGNAPIEKYATPKSDNK